jgi:hypothetical protein
MATKKKSSKRSAKAKAKTKTTARKKTSPKKVAKRQKTVKRPKVTAKRKLAPKKAAKNPRKKATTKKVSAKKQTRNKNADLDPVTFSGLDPRSRSGELAGDLQGLSNRESADSESVDELVEEGNAFEAGVVDGVERAGNEDEREVHTREVPEDDVPGEYLDED